MENEFEGVKNYNIAVKKRGDDITFLRRIVRGGADDSYGIEVAKLSGIPEAVIKRAKQILKKTEEEGIVTYKTAENPDRVNPVALIYFIGITTASELAIIPHFSFSSFTGHLLLLNSPISSYPPPEIS